MTYLFDDHAYPPEVRLVDGDGFVSKTKVLEPNQSAIQLAKETLSLDAKTQGTFGAIKEASEVNHMLDKAVELFNVKVIKINKKEPNGG